MGDSANETWLVIILCFFLLGVWAYRDPETNRRVVELLRESVGVLKRVRWILVIFLMGCVVSVFVEEANRGLAEWAHAREYPGWQSSAAGMDFNLSFALLAARREAIREAADFVWAWPVSIWNGWLAALLWIRFQAQIRRRLFDGKETANEWQGIGWRLVWLCAAVAMVMPGITFFTSWRSVKPPLESRIAVVMVAVGILTFCFVVGCNAFLQCGLLQVVRVTEASTDAGPSSLLDVQIPMFVRLLKFYVVTTLALGAVTFLVRWTRWFHGWQEIVSYSVVPAMGVAMIFVPSVIVLDDVNFAKAWRRNWKLWRENGQLLVALLLPQLVLAFVLALLERRAGWLVRHLPIAQASTRLAFALVRTAISVLWLVLAARLVIGRPLNNPDRLS